MKKCTNCNQPYSDNMKYCSNCGATLTEITEANGQVENDYCAQVNDNVTDNTQQNYSQNGENVYNPSNSYTGMPNQNNVEEGGIIPWLPLILSIGSFFVFGVASIVAFVLLIRNKHIYKYPNVAKVLSIIAMVLWAIGVLSRL